MSLFKLNVNCLRLTILLHTQPILVALLSVTYHMMRCALLLSGTKLANGVCVCGNVEVEKERGSQLSTPNYLLFPQNWGLPSVAWRFTKTSFNDLL